MIDDPPAPDPRDVCTCYDPVSLEYGPNYPCARCQWLEAQAKENTA